MADEHRPEEGNVINLHEVDRYHQDCDFDNEMNYLGLMLNNLSDKGIGTFAIVADEKMVTRFVTPINGRALSMALSKFMQDEPDLYRAVLFETVDQLTRFLQEDVDLLNAVLHEKKDQIIKHIKAHTGKDQDEIIDNVLNNIKGELCKDT
jgi:hypothetical protein